MMDYIKSQAVSDDADETTNWAILAVFGVAAIVWVAGRVYTSLERKSADLSNCIAGSSTLSGSDASSDAASCTSTNSTDHSYNYGSSLS